MFAKKWSFFKIVMVIFVLLSFPGDTAIYLPILSFEKFVVYDSNNEVICAYDYKDLNYENYSFSKQKWTALPVFSIRNTKVDAWRKMKEPLRRKAMLKLSAFLQKK